MIDHGRNYFFVSENVDRLAYYTSLLVSMLSFLYILIYVFRFSFNKTNRVIRELNTNSYAVYIIHLPVIGVFALLLMHISLPAMIKFLLVAVLAFLGSNLLASAYRWIFKKVFSKKVFRLAILVVAVFMTIAIYIKQYTVENNVRTEVSHESTTTPKMGLHTAVAEGNLEIVRQHIMAGSDLNIKETTGGSSPLISAALFGRTEVALALIEAGADVNFKNNEGSTPLITAAFFCRPEIVKALLANGADTSVKNNSGTTALETVTAPFQSVKSVYDYFGNTFGPIGLELDYGYIETTRPLIAEMLQQ